LTRINWRQNAAQTALDSESNGCETEYLRRKRKTKRSESKMFLTEIALAKNIRQRDLAQKSVR